MKILITSDSYTPTINGVVTSVVNLRKELINLGHDVRVLTPSQTNQTYFDQGVTYVSSLGFERVYPGARLALPTEDMFFEELIHWRPEVIHSQCEFGTFIIAVRIAKKLNIPIVHTYHTVYEDYTHYFSPNEKWGKAVVSFLTKKVMDHTERIIVPTDKVRSLLYGYGVAQEINVVPTGIDLERFIKIEDVDAKKRLRQRIGIPEDNRIAVSVGRLAKEKNLEEIIAYIGRYNHPKLTLLIVGDGPHREALEKEVHTLGIDESVVFVGMIHPDQIAAYYQLGDVFVGASNSETQGLTYVEALANGLPLLCKKDTCLDHVIEEGVNGWQYESYETFREKMDMLLKNNALRNSLSESARAVAVAYSSVVFAEKVAEIYQSAISNHCTFEKLPDWETLE